MDDDREALLALLGKKPSSIELDRAALEIARIQYPGLDSALYLALLDDFAAEIAGRAQDLSDGKSFIRAANEYLFGELGFHGNETDYYNPDNSCLNRVLETRAGIPITLSVLYIEVARRLAKPVRGIGLPRHFIVSYDDGRFSAYIDTFDKGALIDEARCRELAGVETLDPEMLAPASKRDIVIRMIQNLLRIYQEQLDFPRAVETLDLLIAAEPASAEEHKLRGVFLMYLKRTSEALGSFGRYLELSPGAPDRARVEQLIRALAFMVASRN